MKARKFMAVAASVLMLMACSAPPPKPAPVPQVVVQPKLNMNDSQDVAGASSVQRDEYKKITIYRGPNIANKQPDQLYIVATKTDFGGISYQIFAIINYSGAWRFYNNAHDTKGNSLDITLMTRHLDKCTRNDCAHSEDIVINVTKKYLEEYMQSGLRIRVSAKAGEDEVFIIPPGYIKAFLSLSEK